MYFKEAAKAAQENRVARKFPPLGDSRYRGDMLFPMFRPKFPLTFDAGTTLFAIGSCFARNIEEALAHTSVDIPTLAYKEPQEGRLDGRPNGIMNEFTPGCISQRIMSALDGRPFSDGTIVPHKSGTDYVDLLLRNSFPVTLERAHDRRKEIDAIYQRLPHSDVAVVTFGYIEAWFDEETKLYLNQKPPHTKETLRSTRYVFKRLDVDDCMALIEPAIDALVLRGVKVILTVSPVPIGATFSADDCVVANEFSKCVLRVCAGMLARKTNVDYFPSYEIVRSGGLSGYREDNVHVKDSVVKQVTQHMIDAYAQP